MAATPRGPILATRQTMPAAPMSALRPEGGRSRRPALLLLAVLSLAVVAGTLLPAPSSAQAHHFPADADLQVMLDRLVEDGVTPGLVLGLIEADGSTRVFTAGTGGPDAPPLESRSVFEIGSINKTFTGVLLADMVLRGEVALDDPISAYLPEGVRSPAREGREITLAELATHRSGLPRLPDNYVPADMGDPYAGYTLEHLYEFLDGHELRRDPGAEGEYSNLGYGLLGHLLARAAGTTYRELLQERILDPLGMEMTTYPLEGEVAAWMTSGHSPQGRVVPYWFTTEAIEGAGGLRSNLDDMLAYLRAHLDPESTDLGPAIALATEWRERVTPNAGIALGWQIAEVDGRRIVTHGGATGGFSARIAFDPELGAGLVLLTNTTQFSSNIGMNLLRGGQALDVADLPLSEADVARYEGTYLLAVGERTLELRIFGEGDELMSQAVGQPVSRLRHQGGHEFAPTFDDAVRLVFTVEDGRTVSVTLHQGGSVFTGERRP